MNFNDWWNKNGPFPQHVSRGFCESAWNAALEEAAKVCETLVPPSESGTREDRYGETAIRCAAEIRKL
jgi:hypothetical protein